MSTTQKMPPPLHVLRGILRHLKTVATSTTTASKTTTTTTDIAKTFALNPMQSYVLSQYRACQSETLPLRIEERQKFAFEYYTLRQDIAERSRLHELDRGAEVQLSAKEMSRRAAARAGLLLPDLNPELEHDLHQ